MGISSPRIYTVGLGFVGLLGLMAYLAVDSGVVLHTAAITSGVVRSEARQRDAALDQLRTEIYQSGIVVRDYLLERDDERARSQNRNCRPYKGRINDSVRIYDEEAS